METMKRKTSSEVGYFESIIDTKFPHKNIQRYTRKEPVGGNIDCKFNNRENQNIKCKNILTGKMCK